MIHLAERDARSGPLPDQSWYQHDAMSGTTAGGYVHVKKLFACAPPDANGAKGARWRVNCACGLGHTLDISE